MAILLEDGNAILLEVGSKLLLDPPTPIIETVNGGNPLNKNSRSVTIEGLNLGSSAYFSNSSEYLGGDVSSIQNILYSFSNLIVFDFVPGELPLGTIYLFVTNEEGTNPTGFPVLFEAETMPASTVAHDAAETLTSQFDAADKTHGFLEAILSPFDEIDSACQYLDKQASFLHGASGTWLDSEGQIIGAKRGALSIPENLFFTFAGPRAGRDTQKSYTQGFDGGYLRSLYGNELAGTKNADVDYLTYLKAKALATFRGTSLCDLEDFVFELFGLVCRAEFSVYSDVILYFSDSVSWYQKNAILKYAPVSACASVSIVEE